MPKGQRRSNREVRKPKKEKPSPKMDMPTGSQVRNALQPKEAAMKGKLSR